MYPHAQDIRYFLEVAETLNISRAAERLGIRQPSLSEALRRLEDSNAEESYRVTRMKRLPPDTRLDFGLAAPMLGEPGRP